MFELFCEYKPVWKRPSSKDIASFNQTAKKLFGNCDLKIKKRIPDTEQTDDTLKKIIGRHSSSSGFCFFSKKRDMQWKFRNKTLAQKKAKQIKTTCPHVSVSIRRVRTNFV